MKYEDAAKIDVGDHVKLKGQEGVYEVCAIQDVFPGECVCYLLDNGTKVTHKKIEKIVVKEEVATKRMYWKDCPICGGGKMILTPNHMTFDDCKIVCTKCGLELKRRTIEELNAAWNTRKPMERIAEQIEFLEHKSIDGIPYINTNDAIEIAKAGGENG